MDDSSTPLFIAGQRVRAQEYRARHDPYRGDLISHVPEANAEEVRRAVAAATEAAELAEATPPYERADFLRRVAELVDAATPELSELMARETGKAITDARSETARTAHTLRISAEEAVRIAGEHVPMGSSKAGADKLGIVLRRPVGVVAAITPYNAPLNLAAHKLGPAIAAGNSVVLKPSPFAASVVHRLCELFIEAGLPQGVLNVVHGDAAGAYLVSDPAVDFVSFTGSTAVGEKIAQSCGLRRTALELGGNGWTVIDADADIELAARTCAANSMRLAGQSCISVQNIAVHKAIEKQFTDLFLNAVVTMSVGDPLSPDTQIGTLINEAAAERVDTAIEKAIAAGSRALLRGRRDGAQLSPTVLTGADPDARIHREEIFGPAANLLAFDRIETAYNWINSSRYGLQSGLFSNSIKVIRQAMRVIRVGGLIINGSSTWRVDEMPYGGVRASGVGREGPRYAIEEMTDPMIVVFND